MINLKPHTISPLTHYSLLLQGDDLYLTNSTTKSTQIRRYKASLAKVFPTRLRGSLS
ncbi:MAG: hypothetical protein F6K47_38850, partial [Symploca sp. SIO2E6]|nr:hypothetical protein [Symploca sp. SIO2E6]